MSERVGFVIDSLIFGIQNFFMQKVLDLFSSKLLLRCMDLSSADHICDVKKN